MTTDFARFVIILLILVVIAVAGCAAIGPDRIGDRSVLRPVSTYSIVARHEATGQIGVAVQSHWFSVGSVVSWAEAGVGAVATQSFADPSYGKLGLEIMRAGRSAPEALAGLLAADAGRDVRQVAMIDSIGRVANWTGSKCIEAAGGLVDEADQFAVQANLMENSNVWPAMAEAYRSARSSGADLAERLLLALEAAEQQGGDIRGRQSAAILIVSPKGNGRPWEERLFDLRVEDHPQPLIELRRLITLQRAYQHMNAGDIAVENGDFELASREYAAAAAAAPGVVEMPFWHAVALASRGRVDEALPVFRQVFHSPDGQRWVTLIPRLVKAELLPSDHAIIDRIMVQSAR